MALLGNITFLGNVQALLAGSIRLPFLGRPTPVAPAASIAWDGCINLDLGVDQGDLLFPIQCARLDVPLSSLKVESDPTTEPFEYHKGGAAIIGIRCGDSALRAAEASELTDLILQHQEVSSFADVNIATSITCATWNIKLAERYTGNFTATTAHPIIFVNGLYDPAAPLASLMNASAGFDGSRVLIQDDYGLSRSIFAGPV